MKRLLPLIFAAFFAADAAAQCQCACVNGRVQAICSSAFDLKPLCPPRMCPATGIPGLPPLAGNDLPPLGTTQCRNVKVYNPQTRRYEWRKVCR